MWKKLSNFAIHPDCLVFLFMESEVSPLTVVANEREIPFFTFYSLKFFAGMPLGLHSDTTWYRKISGITGVPLQMLYPGKSQEVDSVSVLGALVPAFLPLVKNSQFHLFSLSGHKSELRHQFRDMLSRIIISKFSYKGRILSRSIHSRLILPQRQWC